MLDRSPKTIEPGLSRATAATDGSSDLTEPGRGLRSTYRRMKNRPAPSEEEEETSISLLVVRGLVEAAEQVGVSRHELLRCAELDPADLDNQEISVPRSVVYLLCERALELTGDPAFGLHWCERLCGTAFNPV